MPVSHEALAEQALANLISQFARPLDFLRELVQNAIDAGSARIEIWVAFDPPSGGDTEGVLRIGVDDWGEGMDEQVIDNQLTRLFSSTKEDDLTKIGKFGIGFTSIFAIQPQAVLLRTGRHGEYWELVFHADRTFEKRRIDEPVDGTRITLYKRMREDEVPALIDESLTILTYWCEHSDTPITFHDRTRDEPAPQAATDDPFAAFTEDAVPSISSISRPLDLPNAQLQVQAEHDGIEVLVGYGPRPSYGFFNGGLTLLTTQNPDALGSFSGALGHLIFKVKHDQLEHTLTRDNVLQDENHTRAMEAILQVHEQLRALLVERTEAVATGALVEGQDGYIPLSTLHGWLAIEWGLRRRAMSQAYSKRPLFVDHLGAPRSLSEIQRQERQVGSVLLAGEPSPVHEVLHEINVMLIADAPGTRALLQASREEPLLHWFRDKRELRLAEEAFVMPAPVPRSALTPSERTLIDATRELLNAAVGVRVRIPRTRRVIKVAPSEDSFVNRLNLVVGDFVSADIEDDVLALNGPRDGRIFQRDSSQPNFLPAFLAWRTLLINRRHPLFRAHLLASADDLDLAALGLAQALLHAEGRESEGAFQRMLDAYTDRLEIR